MIDFFADTVFTVTYEREREETQISAHGGHKTVYPCEKLWNRRAQHKQYFRGYDPERAKTVVTNTADLLS